ncbi:MAG: ABC transporter substrate-binding protein [Beijerinckiaceae bacterium]|nr:ABC transporter substrate-binding protein [Beijerinckiaceae bacterium]MCZ8301508.1 ABC transporter substrate-binding protein [Beijerinckiaceae bacterium]
MTSVLDGSGTDLWPSRWEWRPDDDSLLIGAGLGRLLGWQPGETGIGARFVARVHAEDLARHQSEMRKLLRGEPGFTCASRVLAANGIMLWLFLSAQAERDGCGRVTLVRGHAHVIEEPRHGTAVPGLPFAVADLFSAGIAALEASEAEKTRRLAAEESAFSQREFLSTVSHEIRNPLTVIFANIGMLRARAEQQRDTGLLQRLAALERAGKHLRDLVSDVLDLAKIEAGHLTVEPEWFELEPLLLEIEEMGNALTRDNGVMFLLDTPLDLGRMMGDRLKLKQIMLNLVGNAAKFTREGRITLSVIDGGSSLIFAVSDTGPGIPPDRLDTLFKAFSQVGGSNAPRAAGTGLGLYISERYVRMLGGRLSVSSRLGEGSTFDFALPRVLQPEVMRVPPARCENRLVIGHTEDLGTLDPHLQMRATNAMIARHQFDSLTAMDSTGRLRPGLAESWEPLGTEGWRFTLRRGVSFHDGTPFDGEDVLATFDRLRKLGGPYASFLKSITRVALPEPYRLDVFTDGAQPLLPIDLSLLSIINRRFRDAETAAFDRLEATLGTGPFRLKARLGSRTLQFDGFPAYWGGPPEWEQLEFRLIDESGLASVSALLAGEVDLIDNVGPDQYLDLQRRDDVMLSTCESNRVWYLFFDQSRDASPFITDRSGKPLDRNPLKDPRVRRAISLSIDREFITTRLMAGQGTPLGDVAGPGIFGVNPALTPPLFDPTTARRLMAEAGYPDGFGITLHGSRDRSFHGATTLRAIALMLNAIGILCKPEALAAAEFYPRAAKRDFSFGLSGWGSVTGETSYTLRLLLCSPDTARGFGGANRGGYANPDLDAIVGEAVRTMDDDVRRRLLERASAIAMGDVAIAPICARRTTWAMKKGLRYEAQMDGALLAMAARRARD